MSIRLHQLKINGTIKNIDNSLFRDIWEILKKEKKTVLIQDKYINSFYDGEISLFWLNLKNYFYSRSIIERINVLDTFIHIIFNEELRSKNKPHIIQFHHETKKDFFSNFKDNNEELRKGISQLYQENSNEYDQYLSYLNRCGNEDEWRFIDKNIDNLIPNSINDRNGNKLFTPTTKNNNRFEEQLFIYISSTSIDTRISEIISSIQCIKQNVIFIDLKGFDQLFLDEILETINKSEYDLKFIIIIDDKQRHKTKHFVNSSIVLKDNNGTPEKISIDNQDILFLIELLKKEMRGIEEDNYCLKNKIKQTIQSIFKYFFLSNFQTRKIHHTFNQIFQHDYMIKEKVEPIIQKMKNGELDNLININEIICEKVKSKKYSTIILSKSNFWLKNDDLFEFKDILERALDENDIDCKVEILNKKYPFSIKDNSLLIYFGADRTYNYFQDKIDNLLLNVDLTDININLDYEDEIDFTLSYDKSNEVIKFDKKLLYYDNSNHEKYILLDTAQDIYEQDIDDLFILKDFSLIKKECEIFLKEKSKKNKIKMEIKKELQKLKYQKYIHPQKKKDYYSLLSHKIVSTLHPEQMVYSKTIERNLIQWVESTNLPMKKELFLILLKFIGMSNEAEKMYKEHKKEVSLNQSAGRDTMKEIEDIFTQEQDVLDFQKLEKTLLNKNYFRRAKLTTIQRKKNENE